MTVEAVMTMLTMTTPRSTRILTLLGRLMLTGVFTPPSTRVLLNGSGTYPVPPPVGPTPVPALSTLLNMGRV
jgi:hypothetical protein